MPFKSTSPNLKKKSHKDNVSASHKMGQNKTKKTYQKNNTLKNNTETGPVIRKVASKKQ